MGPKPRSTRVFLNSENGGALQKGSSISWVAKFQRNKDAAFLLTAVELSLLPIDNFSFFTYSWRFYA